MTHSSIKYLIGVDGGGTGSRAVVATPDGRTLGKGESGPGNISTNPVAARQNILAAVSRAFDDAGIDASHFADSACVMGLAGANIGTHAQHLLSDLPFALATVVSDRETTVQGALGEADGCVAAIGTGSFFCNRLNGVDTNVGGWGFMVSDAGSGARLGLGLLRRTLECYDGLARHSDLTQLVFSRFNNQATELSDFALTAQPWEYAAFARDLITAARAGDPHGQALLQQATGQLEDCIKATGFDGRTKLYLLGGLGPIYQELLSDFFKEACAKPKGDALLGAIEMAKSLARKQGPSHAD